VLDLKSFSNETVQDDVLNLDLFRQIGRFVLVVKRRIFSKFFSIQAVIVVFL